MIGKRKAKKLIELLEKSRVAAKMHNANFSGVHANTVTVNYNDHGFAFGDKVDVTDLIAKETRLYRETWIIDPIDKAIKILEEESE